MATVDLAPTLAADLARAGAEADFSGVVAVAVGDEPADVRAVGYAHRATRTDNHPATRFAIASGSKAFTALAVMRLVERGDLRLDQPVRDVLGDDLPLIDDAVTIEQLLGHTSGIGDYLDEDDLDDIADYVLDVPVHILTTAEAFLPLLDGHPQKSAPGTAFSYCNGGYIVLGVVIERVTGQTFNDAVDELVIGPAGLGATGYPRTDELPADAATGYLFDEGDRVNTLHLPVRGNGDGGAYTTADDLHRFWRALFGGRIVSADAVAAMTRPISDVPDEGLAYGLGFWVHPTGGAALLEGYDAGVSFRSTHLPATATTVSVLGNSSDGAWPVIEVAADAVDAALADGARPDDDEAVNPAT